MVFLLIQIPCEKVLKDSAGHNADESEYRWNNGRKRHSNPQQVAERRHYHGFLNRRLSLAHSARPGRCVDDGSGISQHDLIHGSPLICFCTWRRSKYGSRCRRYETKPAFGRNYASRATPRCIVSRLSGRTLTPACFGKGTIAAIEEP
jgi:hypothetical protein